MRTLLAGFILTFGFVLFCGAIADPHGTLQSPGVGAIILMAVVVAMAPCSARSCIDIDEASAGKEMVRRPNPPSQKWRLSAPRETLPV
jgi:hypothetical protein